MTREEYLELINHFKLYAFNNEEVPDETVEVPLTAYDIDGIISALEEIRNY